MFSLLREFFKSLHSMNEQYQFQVRHAWSGRGTGIYALDHTMKIFSKMRDGQGLNLWPARLTMWNNTWNTPVVAINVGTTSMDDPAMVKAFNVWNHGEEGSPRRQVKLIFVDNPHRDAPGVARRLPGARHSTDGVSQTIPRPRVLASSAELRGVDFDAHTHTPVASVESGADVDARHGDLEPELDRDLVRTVEGLVDTNDAVLARSQLLRAAIRVVDVYAKNPRPRDTGIRLPSSLTVDERRQVHAHVQANHSNLRHESLTGSTNDDNDERFMSIARVPRASSRTTTSAYRALARDHVQENLMDDAAAATVESGPVNEDENGFNIAWALDKIKYDPRHWLANWFIMVRSLPTVAKIIMYACARPARQGAVWAHYSSSQYSRRGTCRRIQSLRRCSNIFVRTRPTQCLWRSTVIAPSGELTW